MSVWCSSTLNLIYKTFHSSYANDYDAIASSGWIFISIVPIDKKWNKNEWEYINKYCIQFCMIGIVLSVPIRMLTLLLFSSFFFFFSLQVGCFSFLQRCCLFAFLRSAFRLFLRKHLTDTKYVPRNRYYTHVYVYRSHNEHYTYCNWWFTVRFDRLFIN